MNHLVFVYGTLRRGFHWHEVILHTHPIATVEAQGRLMTDGTLPYLLAGDSRVVGEVYEVSAKTLHTLDHLEYPSGYERSPITITYSDGRKGDAEAYFFTAGDGGLREIPGGDFASSPIAERWRW